MGSVLPDLSRFYLPSPVQPLQSCTPPAAGIRKAREALPSDFGAQVWDWLPRAPQPEGSGSQRIVSTSAQDTRGLAGIPGTCPQPADVPIPSVQTSHNSSLLQENHPAATARNPRGESAKPPPALPHAARVVAGHGCENTARTCTQIKGILLTFSYSSSKAGAHRLCTGSCPMCPGCCH